MSLFALPRVGRAGLGNELLPWARAEIFGRTSHARMLAPHWPLFRLGPYVRREPDKRNYRVLFDDTLYGSALKRAAICMLGRRYHEQDGALAANEARASARPVIVEFRGIERLFAPLIGHDRFIRDRLWALTKSPLRPAARPYGGRFIAMHVRRGDITRQGFAPEELLRVNQYTSLQWFEGMAYAIRRHRALQGIPITVFTDGSPDEVAALTAIDGVILHQRASPITDLWTLAEAALLFASGYSTFSMWASFLAGMPTFYAPGKLQQRVLVNREDALETELDAGADIPATAIERVSS